MKFDCRTKVESIAPAGSMGLIVGVIVVLCICLCIVGAIAGNKGGDEEVVEVVEIEEGGPMVVYE